MFSCGTEGFVFSDTASSAMHNVSRRRHDFPPYNLLTRRFPTLLNLWAGARSFIGSLDLSWADR